MWGCGGVAAGAVLPGVLVRACAALAREVLHATRLPDPQLLHARRPASSQTLTCSIWTVQLHRPTYGPMFENNQLNHVSGHMVLKLDS